MQMFVRVIEKGSFSAVAKERGIGQPAVSKQVSALEDELGTELIHRTSRSIALTEPGRDFYASALRILDDFENATSRIGRGQTAPKGLIRVTVPPTFARLHMVSKLPAFFAAYPDMAVEMGASESPPTIRGIDEGIGGWFSCLTEMPRGAPRADPLRPDFLGDARWRSFTCPTVRNPISFRKPPSGNCWKIFDRSQKSAPVLLTSTACSGKI